MRAIRYHENKEGDDFSTVLKMEIVSIPKATPGIAIVKVAACASNPIDFKVCILQVCAYIILLLKSVRHVYFSLNHFYTSLIVVRCHYIGPWWLFKGCWMGHAIAIHSRI
jgi:hypothetical protein